MTKTGNYYPQKCVHLFLFFFPPIFNHRVPEIWSRLMLKICEHRHTKKIHFPSYLSLYFHMSTHPPLSWAYLAVDPELPGGQFKKVSAADSWENTPFLFHALSLERRQQQLLTWPYRSQMLQGTFYCINSTPCFFLLESSVGPLDSKFLPMCTSLLPKMWSLYGFTKHICWPD